ncbi:MAG: phosphoglycerate kinase [Clostridiales bacterium]|nr:phosphoglycerate kinase [Clostridiales bacterium]
MDGFRKKTVRDADVQGQTVLLRVDFNVKVQDGKITEDARVRAALPTIEYLISREAALIIISHLGRPKGVADKKYSLKPVAELLRQLLGRPVLFAGGCLGAAVEKQAAALCPGQILMLENLRFHEEEEENDPVFAGQLAKLADIYVDDAFGMAHRAHASNEGVAEYLPAYAGLLLESEMNSLSKALDGQERPVVAVIGGAKVSDKIGMIKNLLDKVDKLLIGGGMANTFLAAQGCDMQGSAVEEDRLPWIKELLCGETAAKLVLPADVVAAEAFTADSAHKTVKPRDIPAGWLALDIGPATRQIFADEIAKARTVVWNGPVGVFEMEPFAAGTMAVAQAVADSGAYSVVGGGDSIAAVNQAQVAEKISFISTGGGAMLKFLEGKKLPGVAALENIN